MGGTLNILYNEYTDPKDKAPKENQDIHNHVQDFCSLITKLGKYDNIKEERERKRYQSKQRQNVGNTVFQLRI